MPYTSASTGTRAGAAAAAAPHARIPHQPPHPHAAADTPPGAAQLGGRRCSSTRLASMCCPHPHTHTPLAHTQQQTASRVQLEAGARHNTAVTPLAQTQQAHSQAQYSSHTLKARSAGKGLSRRNSTNLVCSTHTQTTTQPSNSCTTGLTSQPA
jgi:hypothetical protein